MGLRIAYLLDGAVVGTRCVVAPVLNRSDVLVAFELSFSSDRDPTVRVILPVAAAAGLVEDVLRNVAAERMGADEPWSCVRESLVEVVDAFDAALREEG